MRLLLAAAIVGATLTIAARQEAPLPRFRTGVEVIQLDVTVLDQDRRPVIGLKPGDFTVLEDGRPRPIVAFDEIAVPETAAPAAAWTRDIFPDVRTNDVRPEGRLIVVVMDDATLPPDARFVESSKTIAHRIVDTLGPADLAAVVFTLNNDRSQDFTADRERLRSAIDAFSFGFAFVPPLRGADGRPDPADRSQLAELSLYHRYSVAVLGKATEALRAVDHARKTVFYIGVGAYVDSSTAATPVLIGPNSTAMVSDHAVQLELHRQLADLFDHAVQSNVNIYAMQPGGLDGLADFLQARGFNSTDPRQRPMYEPRVFHDYLNTVSVNSGGYAVLDTNAPENRVAQIFRENSSYYLVGFQRADTAADGKFHKIEVRVDRPRVTVQARNGYVAPRPENPGKKDARRAKDPPSPLVTAMAGFLPKGDIPMTAVASPVKVPGKDTSALAITASLRQPAPGTREVHTIELLTRAFDAQGKPRGSSRQTGRLTFKPIPGGEAHFEVLSRLDLKPGRYSLRIAAHNTTTAKSGSVYIDVVVPNFTAEPLALSGVMLTTTHPRQAAPPDGLASLLPVLPTGIREFRREDAVAAFARIYQGGRQPHAAVTLHATVVDASGRLHLDTSSVLEARRFGGDAAADFRVELPVTALPAGEYLLTLEASKGAATARRHVRFTIARD